MWDRLRAWLGFASGPASRPDDEWLLELDGRVLAQLLPASPDDMFWVRYRIVPKGEDALPTILDTTLWDRCRFSYRNVRTGKLNTDAFSAGHTSAETLRELSVLLRALS
jgi:hypothetical protein